MGRVGQRPEPNSPGAASSLESTIGSGWSQADEDALLARARNGDHRAFTTLVQRHDRQLRRLTGRLLGARGSMDDALQESYLKAYRRVATFDGRSRFGSWLYAITYRTCLDHLRANGRRHEVELTDSHDSGGTKPPIDDQVALRQLLDRALLDIAPEFAATVLLVDGEGLSYDEAATVLGVSPGTIASRLSRARRDLRQRIGVGGEQPDAGSTNEPSTPGGRP